MEDDKYILGYEIDVHSNSYGAMSNLALNQAQGWGEFAAAVNREAEKEIYEFFSFVWFNIKQEASPACYIPSTQGTFS